MVKSTLGASMYKAELIRQCKTGKLKAKIICTADSSHYVVGAENRVGEFIYAAEENEQLLMAPSLEQAKRFFKKYGVEKVQDELQSAYDEMIGLPSDYGHSFN
jgi:hypothetical protein